MEVQRRSDGQRRTYVALAKAAAPVKKAAKGAPREIVVTVAAGDKIKSIRFGDVLVEKETGRLSRSPVSGALALIVPFEVITTKTAAGALTTCVHGWNCVYYCHLAVESPRGDISITLSVNGDIKHVGFGDYAVKEPTGWLRTEPLAGPVQGITAFQLVGVKGARSTDVRIIHELGGRYFSHSWRATSARGGGGRKSK